MDNIVVVGTDTGVGKTVLSLLLMQFFEARGYQPFYVKPFQTGCKKATEEGSDAAFVYRHLASLKDKDPTSSVLHCFPNPKAPYFAARDENRDIDVTCLENFITKKNRTYSPLIVEAAGGLLVPVRKDVLFADIIRKTHARVVLAARAGLGTINHTLLSLEALRSRDIQPAGIIFLDSEGTAPDLIEENREAIRQFGKIAVAGVISRIANFADPPKTCYEPLQKLMLHRGIKNLSGKS